MGQKVNPHGIRLGIVKDWSARWYAASKDFANVLCSDLQVRDFLRKRLAPAGISRIQIDRPARNAKIVVYAARPGVIMGKGGKEIENLRDEVFKIIKVPVHISIEEVRKPETDATLVAESIAQQIERRVMFRRAMKRAVTSTMRLGAKGIKVTVAGRLGGSEIARTEWYREGRVPLHTVRAEIDYGTAEAFTTYGVIGVKVWIFKGEVLGDKEAAEGTEQRAEKPAKEETK
jgi:small subunit ribosomal protein S3